MAQRDGSVNEKMSGTAGAAGWDADGRPTYAASFQCIGPACEDHCCGVWTIPLDRRTYEAYREFPPERLGAEVAEYVSISPAGSAPGLYAQIQRAASGLCPFFAADRLCGIQKEYGGGLLSASCSIYPRALNVVAGELEGSLMLSCPEAARQVLLRPGSTRVAADMGSGAFRTDNFFTAASASGGAAPKPVRWLKLLRAWLVAMVQDRTRPLWQRVLLIGSVCKQLDEVPAEERDSLVPAILSDYRQILGTVWGTAELDAMASHAEARLTVVKRLSAERVEDRTCGARFQETYWSFAEGIGLGSGSGSGGDVERFRGAEQKYYLPFMKERPFILENYLLNYIYQNLFPFGREGSARFIARTMFAEFVLMAAQFGWVQGLLIGMAGCYKERFSEEYVVLGVQSFSREVEHDPSVLTRMMEFLTTYELNNLPGMAILLKS